MYCLMIRVETEFIKLTAKDKGKRHFRQAFVIFHHYSPPILLFLPIVYIVHPHSHNTLKKILDSKME